jgi:hypothetical protein
VDLKDEAREPELVHQPFSMLLIEPRRRVDEDDLYSLLEGIFLSDKKHRCVCNLPPPAMIRRDDHGRPPKPKNQGSSQETLVRPLSPSTIRSMVWLHRERRRAESGHPEDSRTA